VAKARAKKENAIVRYIRETRSELQKVRWPTRQEAIRLTQIVLVVTIAMSLFLWLADIFFSWWLGGVVLTSDPLRIGLSVVAVVGIIIAVALLSRQRE